MKVGKFDEPEMAGDCEVFNRDRIREALERLERTRPDLYARMAEKQSQERGDM